MAIIRSLVVKIKGDSSSAVKMLKTTAKEFKKTGSEIQSVGKSLTLALTVPTIAAGAAAYKLASDYQEAINKVDVVFGENAKTVKSWSETTLRQFGIASGTALDMASNFGDMATSMGYSDASAAKLSTSLVGLAGDLASFKNIGIDQANTALEAIFTGETKSLKALGIVMTEANLQAYALTQGITKSVQEMSQGEKVALRYAYVYDKAQNSIGDFARTGGNAANQMRIFKESVKQLGTSFGQNLLPMITPVITKLNELMIAFGQLNYEQKQSIIYALAFTASIGPITKVVGVLVSGTGLAIGKISALIAAISGGGGLVAALSALLTPAGLVIAVLATLGTEVYLVAQSFDSFKVFIGAYWKVMKAQFTNGVNQVVQVFRYMDYQVSNITIGMVNRTLGDVQKLLEIYGMIPVIGKKYKTAAAGVGELRSTLQNIVAYKKQLYEESKNKTASSMQAVYDAQQDMFLAWGAWSHDATAPIEDKISGIRSLFSGIKELFSGTDMELPDLTALELANLNFDDLIAGLESAGNAATTANSALETMVDTVKSLVSEIKSQTREFANFVGMFDIAEKKFVSGESLMRRLKGQLMTMEQWQEGLLTLQNKGMSKYMVNELRNLGAGSANEIVALSKLSSSQLAEYESLYSRKNAIASNQAMASVSYSKSAENIIETQIVLDVTGNYILGSRDLDALTNKIINRLKTAGVMP